jgi:hypothetical protein
VKLFLFCLPKEGLWMVVSTSQPPADRTTIATLSQQVGVGVRRGDPPRLDEGADLSSSLRTVDVVF